MKLTKEFIIEKVCQYYGLTIAEIKSKSKRPEISVPKKIVWMYCRENIKPKPTLLSIGDGFSGSTHGNVHSGINRIIGWIENDVNLIKDIESLDEIILNKTSKSKEKLIKRIKELFGEKVHNSFIEILDYQELINTEEYD